MRRQPRLTTGPGFTLVELLVVIAVIAVIAAIVFPVLARSGETARKTTCTSNLKQISLATSMYLQDYDETYPSSWGWDARDHLRSSGTMWRVCLQPYLPKLGASDGSYGESSGAGNFYGTYAGEPWYNPAGYDKMSVLSCPDAPTSAAFGPTSYGQNINMCSGWSDDGVQPGIKLAQVQRAANFIAYADASSSGGTAYTANGATDPNFHKVGDDGPFNYNFNWKEGFSVDWCFGHWDGNGFWDDPSRPEARRPAPRHHGKVNAAFFDGHVKSLSPAFINVPRDREDDYMTNH